MSDTATVAQDWTDVAAAWDAHVDEVDEPQRRRDGGAPRSGGRAAGRSRPRAGRRAGQPRRDLVGARRSERLGRAQRHRARHGRGRPAPQPLRLATSRSRSSTPSAIDRPDASFDVVACRMGLMFTPDPAVAFRRDPPGARPRRPARGADLGRHRAQPVDDLRRHGRHGERPRAGGPPIGPGGIFSLGDPDQLATLAEDAGFARRRRRPRSTSRSAPPTSTRTSSGSARWPARSPASSGAPRRSRGRPCGAPPPTWRPRSSRTTGWPCPAAHSWSQVRARLSATVARTAFRVARRPRSDRSFECPKGDACGASGRGVAAVLGVA